MVSSGGVRISYSHGGILEHVGNNEEPDHTSPDVYLIQLGYTTVALRHGDVLQRDVQVILGWRQVGTRQYRASLVTIKSDAPSASLPR